METKSIELSGWGRYPRRVETVICPEQIADAVPPPVGRMIARGQGRSYGDAAMLADGLVMLTEQLAEVSELNEATGILTAQAGATLAEVIDTFLPRGWFPAVVPGTRFVSLGGCVAADIHGKNHHRDSGFGAHVDEIEIVLADGSRRRCSPRQNSDLFWATVGGMGLTGIITEVSFQLIPVETSYLMVQHDQAKDLDQSFKVLSDKAWDDHYTVAWIDCLAKKGNVGRGVLMRGHHARRNDLPDSLRGQPFAKARRQRNLGFDFPSWTLNSVGMRAFNELYYRLQGRRQRPFIADYEGFFFPLDRIGNWNRIYGKRGFIQYQCVLPAANAFDGMRALLEAQAAAGRSSFLSVLKRFGPQGQGLLSFPFEGYTLTLDLPVDDDQLLPFLDRLDDIVLQHGGRVYLAKDARLAAPAFRAMYPRLAEWLRVKSAVDPENCFDSDLARRLEIVTAAS
ncbi:MAG: linked oxidase domain protein [Acidobacteria bacterium]|nr:linked oxidase domain protein [Acidobacteriota bacterium]